MNKIVRLWRRLNLFVCGSAFHMFAEKLFFSAFLGKKRTEKSIPRSIDGYYKWGYNEKKEEFTV